MFGNALPCLVMPTIIQALVSLGIIFALYILGWGEKNLVSYIVLYHSNKILKLLLSDVHCCIYVIAGEFIVRPTFAASIRDTPFHACILPRLPPKYLQSMSYLIILFIKPHHNIGYPASPHKL